MCRPHRIAVIGPSGSGKTSLGRWIEQHLGLPFTDLDDLHWRPGWSEAPLTESRAAVDATTHPPRWVVAGNYAKVRDLIWPRAELIVWLDLPLATVLRRSTARALRQWWTREPICNGNRQTLAHMVIGHDALLLYTLRTFHARRRDWPALLGASARAEVQVQRLCSARAVAAWQRAAQATLEQASRVV